MSNFIIKSKTPRIPKPLAPGEFENILQELQAAYLQVVGRVLPLPPPPDFLPLVQTFGGERLLSKSTWDFGDVSSFTFGTGHSVITTAVMTAVAERIEYFLTEDQPWTLLLDPEFGLTRYLLAADRPLRQNERARKCFERASEVFEEATGKPFGELFYVRKRFYDWFIEAYGTKFALGYLEEWLEHAEEFSPCPVLDFLTYARHTSSPVFQEAGQELLAAMNVVLVQNNLPVQELTPELRSRLQRFCARYTSFEERWHVFTTWAVKMDGLIWARTGKISHVLFAFLSAKALRKAELAARRSR